MKISFGDSILKGVQTLVDSVHDLVPAQMPSDEILRSTKLVAHRGAHGPGDHENKMPGFMTCSEESVWAVEFDIRWTKDQVPVVLHDPHTGRTYKDSMYHPGQLQWAELNGHLPLLPSLEQVVKNIGSYCHLMIECKETLTEERQEILLQTLAPLQPEQDYHLLTLNPRLLSEADRISKRALVFVSEVNAKAASQFVLEQKWGGIAGHYLLQSAAMIKAHHNAGQRVGVGFITSFNNVCRQIARGADWLFSDQAVHLQQSLRRHLDRSQTDR